MENISKDWELTQIGIVVKDVEKVIERLEILGMGPFKGGSLPPDREEYFRGERMYADFDIRSTISYIVHKYHFATRSVA